MAQRPEWLSLQQQQQMGLDARSHWGEHDNNLRGSGKLPPLEVRESVFIDLLC